MNRRVITACLLSTLTAAFAHAEVTQTLAISPASPTANCQVTLAANASARLTIRVAVSGKADNHDYALKADGKPKVVRTKSGTLLWLGPEPDLPLVGTEHSGTYTVVNTAATPQITTVTVTCKWGPQAPPAGNGGVGGKGNGGGAAVIPPDISGLAQGDAILTVGSRVTWGFTPKSQGVGKIINWTVEVADANGNPDPTVTGLTVSSANVDPGIVRWTIENGPNPPGSLSGTLKSDDPSTGYLKATFTGGIGSPDTSATLLMFVAADNLTASPAGTDAGGGHVTYCWAESGQILVTATPKPVLAENLLPACWVMTGGIGNGKLEREVALNVPGVTEIVAESGISRKSIKIEVVKVGAVIDGKDAIRGTRQINKDVALQSYDVPSETLVAAEAFMLRNTPCQGDGGPHGFGCTGPKDGKIDTNTGNFELVSSERLNAPCCEGGKVWKVVLRINTANIDLHLQRTMPRWTKYNNACERAQREWDRFYAALENHEKAHESLYGEMAEKMAADMLGLTATAYACTREAAEQLASDRLTARFNDITQLRSQEYDQKQTQFDNANPTSGVVPVACP